MKKKLLILAFFIISMQSINILAQDTIKVSCVGNSITDGPGMTRGLEDYPAQLNALLGSRYALSGIKCVVSNYGVSGTTMLKKVTLPIGIVDYFRRLWFRNPIL